MLLKTSAIPLYLQIHTILRQRITSGMYEPGKLLPSETQMIEEFNVTRATLRNAIKLLQEDGLAVTEKGKGTFVNSVKKEQSLFKFYSFGRDYSGSEYNSNTFLTSAEEILPNESIKEKFNQPSLGEISKISRIRYMDNIPVIAEISYIPIKIAPNIIAEDLNKFSIYDLLENKYRTPIKKAREYLNAVNCTKTLASQLKTKVGDAVFLVERITYTENDEVIEYRTSYIRGDKFKFFVDL